MILQQPVSLPHPSWWRDLAEPQTLARSATWTLKRQWRTKREAKTRRDNHRMIFFTVYDTWSATLVFVDGFRTSCKQFQGTKNTMAPKWKTSGWKNFPGAIRRELGGCNKTTKGWISYNYMDKIPKIFHLLRWFAVVFLFLKFHGSYTMTISPLVDPVSGCLYVSTSEPKLKELVKFSQNEFHVDI